MLYYLSRRRLPSDGDDVTQVQKMANSIQKLRMCQGFAANDEEVCYVCPRNGEKEPSWESLSEYYGLSSEFDIRTVPAPDTNHNFPLIPDTDDQSLLAWLLYAYASGVFDEGDIIYTRTLQPARYFLQIREWLGGDDDISFWFEQHQIERDIDGPILDKDFYKQMDGLVCISEKQKEAMVEAHPIDREKIYVHHDGVDLRSYENWTKTGAREDLGMELNEDIVMYTGHLYPEKDVETLVKAAKHFEEQCIIVGGYPEDVSRIKSNITVPDNVTFTGFVPPSEIPLYQTAADVLVATVGANNDTDYFSPLKLFEYMAAGKPMVVSRKPEFEEILSHQESALMVKPESVSEMAEAINRCLDDANLGMQLGQRARERVDQYDWRVRAQNILTDIRTRRM